MKNLIYKLIKTIEIDIYPLEGDLFIWAGCGYAFKNYDIAEIKYMHDLIGIRNRTGGSIHHIIIYKRL